jgi:adenylate cyclase
VGVIPPRPANLRQLAEASGVAADEIDAAEADGTLGLVLIDRIVTDAGRFTKAEVQARTGLGDRADRFWRALGFPDPAPDEKVFGPTDVEMLQLIDTVLRLELLEEETALQLARVIGSSLERIAQSQIDAIEARIDAGDPAADGDLAVQRAQFLLPTVPRILEYVWRRHLQVAARRRMVRDSIADDARRGAVSVGFADLVGFTALSQQLDERELAHVVDRFEATAYDLVATRGGRVVKMIGDEVMFEVATPVAALELALDLAAAYHGDESISDVRVGVAHGPVLAREGDLYGPTVNLASRIVSIAYPGSVVVSAEVREACADDPRFAWKTLRTRYLKHIGRVQLHAVRRAEDVAEGFAERARRRRGAVRDTVAELVERRIGEQPR